MVGDSGRNASFRKQLNAVSQQFLNKVYVMQDISGLRRMWRKDLTMLDPMIGTRTCSLCKGTYESDIKLHEHQRMAHRGRGNEEKTKPAAVVPPSDDLEV